MKRRWRVVFVDPTTERHIELDVEAETVEMAREAAWALLRAKRPKGLVVVELVDVRAIDDTPSSRGGA